MDSRVSASSAPNGSSSSSSCGSATSARASETRCAWPPDSVSGHASAWSARPISASACSERVSGRIAWTAGAVEAVEHIGQHVAPGKEPRLLKGDRGAPATSRLTGVVGGKPCQHPQYRRLAAATATDQRDDLVGADLQGDVVEDRRVPYHLSTLLSLPTTAVCRSDVIVMRGTSGLDVPVLRTMASVVMPSSA